MVKISFKAIAAAFVASVLLAGPAVASGKGAPEINKVVRVQGTIVDVAVSNPAFSTLVTALDKAKLVDVLKGPGPFTVYAPTNDAFGKIPADVLDDLLADPAGALTEVLLYHVTPGKQDLRFAYLTRDLRTLQDQEVFAERERNTLFINNSRVLGSAIVTDNGVIYVIDSVLLPQYR